MKKKPLLGLALLLLVGLVGATLAYFTFTTTITNKFTTKEYGGTKVEQTITPPTDWEPGDETEADLDITNTSGIDVAVRVKFDEKWESKKGAPLSLTIEDDDEHGGESVAILGFASGYEENWTKEEDNYYYYTTVLKNGSKAEKLLEKVTFNPNVKPDLKCDTEGGVTTCSSSGNGYDGATYTLTITIETIDAAYVDEAWPNSPLAQ